MFGLFFFEIKSMLLLLREYRFYFDIQVKIAVNLSSGQLLYYSFKYIDI